MERSIDRKKVLEIIEKVIGEFNDQQTDEERKIVFGSNVVLFGKGGHLKSIELVTLLVDLEYYLEAELGISNVLTSKKAMSQTSSPFRTVTTLTDFICSFDY